MEDKIQKNERYIYQTTKKIITKLMGNQDSSSTKAILANLRNSIGKDFGGSIAIWPIMLEYMPDEFIGKSVELSFGEKAVLNTMQLYALYKQGNRELKENNSENGNIGVTFSRLRVRYKEESKTPLDRRFNTMITATTYDELLYHLRQMIGILKSKSKGDIYMDFPKLSEDLYWFMRGKEESLRISWSREYYKNRNENAEHRKGDNDEKQ